MSFAIEIARFKEWALQCEGTFGEWECDYEHWHSLYAVTQKLMSSYADELPDSEICLDLLYVIARDNESGILRDDLESYPELLRHLARLAVDSAESDAKYQIVEAVAAAKLSDAADLIRPYLSDSDEYVRRISLLAIAPFSPVEAEKLAITWIDEEYEYSRIAALHVLHIVNSDDLSFYLERHANDLSQYVRAKVAQILRERQEV